MSTKATQCVEILEFMKEYGSITPLQALEEIGCMRLAARISDLKKAGYQIESRQVSRKTEIGKKMHYSEYRLAV